MTDTTIQPIALSKLVPFAGNVRKTQNKGFIDELAASIKAHGLQQNLVVKKEGKKFAVVAGGQRLKALHHLAKAGDIAPDYPVPCKIAEGAFDPIEISLRYRGAVWPHGNGHPAIAETRPRQPATSQGLPRGQAEP